MRLFGREVTLSIKRIGQLQSVESRGGWWPIIHEPDTGSWQQNISITLDNTLTHPTVFSCVTLIASTFGKPDLNFVRHDRETDIWEIEENPAYSPFLRKPNPYQTIGKFLEQWMFSKLIWGNAYALKERDNRGVVVAAYLLDPNRVHPLVAEDGSVYYDLMRDTLSNQPQDHVVAPAREIFHDPMWTFYHPLVGLPPLYASNLLATLGTTMFQNSASFFANGSRPGGILIAPKGITDTQAADLKTQWEATFGNATGKPGSTAVLGGELQWVELNQPAEKTQLTEQWGKIAEAISSAFHTPFHMVGGPMPTYNNVQALNIDFYVQCMQPLFKQCESVLDDGLGLGRSFGNDYGTMFALDDLLLMDSSAMISYIKDGVSAGVFSPNEGRQMRNLGPVTGGESPYLQQQNYSLEALAKRDATDDPFGTTSAIAAGVPDITPARRDWLGIRKRAKGRAA